MFRNRTQLSNREGKLFVERVSATVLVQKFSTPLYVYSEARIRENVQRVLQLLRKYIPQSELYYAVKANNNLSILSLLCSLGLGADTAGPLEIQLAKKAGFKKEKILYSGVFHSDAELKTGLREGVAINVDSLSAATRLLKFGKPPLFSMRINPGAGHGKFAGLVTAGPDAKFGVGIADAVAGYKLAQKKGVQRFGLHMMTGSCILDAKYFGAITEKLLALAGEIRQKTGIQFEFIDIGGGLGIPYRESEKILDIESAIKNVATNFSAGVQEYALGQPKLRLEPGRYLVGDAGILLTQVHTIKQGAKKKFVGVDAGMQTLLRPMLYGAYHELVLANDLQRKSSEVVSVVGPICENTDQIAKDRRLPKLKEGDLLGVLDVGAYGFGMASQYNTRARPAEVLVSDKRVVLIREPEGFAEIVGKQQVPQWLR